MTNLDLAQYKLPDTPGVYIFHGPRGNIKDRQGRDDILYIGRATPLRDRVRSYFGDDLIKTRGPLLVDMVMSATRITWQETDSVLEAVILEASLIKKHTPYYNTKEKDNRSYYFVIITKEDYPRLLLVRGRTLDIAKKSGLTLDYKVGSSFGPFPSASILFEALKIIRKIFPFRDKCIPNQGRPCFHRQIGLCPGVCTGEISRLEYAKTIRNIKLFFQGNKARLVSSLTRDMDRYARAEQFEQAGKIKKILHAITHIQDIALIKVENVVQGVKLGFRIEAYDVAHISGTDTVGVMTVVSDGSINKNEYRKFKITHEKGAHESLSLSEIIKRRLRHIEWPKPDIIVVDGNDVQINTVKKIISLPEFQMYRSTSIVSVVKDQRHKARAILNVRPQDEIHSRGILLANTEAHRFALAYHRLLRLKSRGL